MAVMARLDACGRRMPATQVVAHCNVQHCSTSHHTLPRPVLPKPLSFPGVGWGTVTWQPSLRGKIQCLMREAAGNRELDAHLLMVSALGYHTCSPSARESEYGTMYPKSRWPPKSRAVS